MNDGFQHFVDIDHFHPIYGEGTSSLHFDTAFFLAAKSELNDDGSDTPSSSGVAVIPQPLSYAASVTCDKSIELSCGIGSYGDSIAEPGVHGTLSRYATHENKGCTTDYFSNEVYKKSLESSVSFRYSVVTVVNTEVTEETLFVDAHKNEKVCLGTNLYLESRTSCELAEDLHLSKVEHYDSFETIQPMYISKLGISTENINFSERYLPNDVQVHIPSAWVVLVKMMTVFFFFALVNVYRE